MPTPHLYGMHARSLESYRPMKTLPLFFWESSGVYSRSLMLGPRQGVVFWPRLAWGVG